VKPVTDIAHKTPAMSGIPPHEKTSYSWGKHSVSGRETAVAALLSLSLMQSLLFTR